MSLNISATCTNCSSNEFYKDNQGNVICVYCQTQSQDYFAESNEMEDGALSARIGGRLISSRHSTVIKSKPSALQKSNPETLAFLKVFQYCLRVLMYAATDASQIGIASRGKYMQCLKRMWMCYLSEWRDSTSKCSISDAFSEESQTCTCPEGHFLHPLFPSKPLLLGFIYIVFRLQRSWVVPSDIVLWCRRGIIPYNRLWESVPESAKVDLQERHRLVFTTQHRGSTRVVSGNNILFHAASIADSLGITIPPLNCPLMARRMIYTLGLPGEVWCRFSSICRLQLPGDPLIGADPASELYAESVVAVVLMAVKMCKGWERGSLDRVTDESRLSSNRRALSTTLLQTMQSVPSIAVANPHEAILRPNPFNGALRGVLADDAQKPDWSRISTSDSSFGLNDSALRSDIFESQHCHKSVVHTNWTDTTAKRLPSKVHNAVLGPREADCTYAVNSRFADATGLLGVEHLILLEKFAAHGCVPPPHLQQLLERLEAQLLRFALSGATTAERGGSREKCVARLSSTAVSVETSAMISATRKRLRSVGRGEVPRVKAEGEGDTYGQQCIR